MSYANFTIKPVVNYIRKDAELAIFIDGENVQLFVGNYPTIGAANVAANIAAEALTQAVKQTIIERIKGIEVAKP